MKRLALFDFDGTLTTKDSLFAFIRFYKGAAKFWTGLFILSPILMLYKLKIIANWRAKEYVLGFFFRGEDVEYFNSRGEAFAQERIPRILRTSAMEKLKWHLKEQDEVVVVTASAVNWIKPWVSRLNVNLVATELQVENGRVTGKLLGKNCYGPEKVTRLCHLINLEDYADIYVYGDSKGDRELLELATQRFYRKF